MRRVLMIVLICSSLGMAEDLLVVTGAKSPITAVDAVTLRAIYLKKRRFWKEMKLTPINLPADSMLRRRFETHIVAMSARKLDDYWMKMHYKGTRPPFQVRSVEGVIGYIKKIKGAIGYIPESKADTQMKILYRIKG